MNRTKQEQVFTTEPLQPSEPIDRFTDLLDCIASVCHEANRMYCIKIGSFIHDRWEESSISRSMRRAVAWQLFHPVSPEQAHTRWVENRRNNGWEYGEKKSNDTTGGKKKTHPNIVLWDDLSPAEQAKDYLFTAIVDAFAAQIETQNIMQAAREYWLNSDSDVFPDYISDYIRDEKNRGS